MTFGSLNFGNLTDATESAELSEQLPLCRLSSPDESGDVDDETYDEPAVQMRYIIGSAGVAVRTGLQRPAARV